MIILSAYSLVRKLAVSVAFRPNRVRKFMENVGQGESIEGLREDIPKALTQHLR